MKKLNHTDCILERVYVETPVDTDGDGKLDLVAVYITRPVSTLQGEQVPAVYVANPYMMTCNDADYQPHNVDCEVEVYPQQNIRYEDIRYDFSKEPVCEPAVKRETTGFAETSIQKEKVGFDCISPLYEYLNQKGYASVFCAGLGTKGSEGYTLTGSREEILAFKSVIDWLNGRCRAFTDKENNIEIKASWCTGKVAMSAKSYLGTMCIGVAATGVEGLETIIPEAGIASWYDYYRCGGLNVPALGWQGDDLDTLAKYCFSRKLDADDYAKCGAGYEAAAQKLTDAQDRASGNYNRFWDERNYLNQIDNMKASVFIIHGINDWNVKTNQCCPLFAALEEKGIERMMLLHQGEHIYVYDLEGAPTLDLIERWLEHYLKGVDNGIETDPKVYVESNLNQLQWMKSETWPPTGWAYEEFPFPQAASGSQAVIVDDLSATVYDREKDNLQEWLDELVLATTPEYKNRIKFVYDPFETKETGLESLRIAGTIKLAFDAALDNGTAILSAMLVDLGEDHRITAKEIKVGDEGDPDLYRFGLEEQPSAYRVISRGWLNAQNRSSLYCKDALEIGIPYRYEIDMIPTDYSVKAGHKLALILYGIDAQATQRPDTVTRITVNLDSVTTQIPFVK